MVGYNSNYKGNVGVRRAFPLRLALALKCCNMNAAQLAKITRISTTAISNYKAGKGLPAPSQLKRMVEAFGTTEHWLLGLEDLSVPTARMLPKGLTPDAGIDLTAFKEYSRPSMSDLLDSQAAGDSTIGTINHFAYRALGDPLALATIARLRPNELSISIAFRSMLAQCIVDRFNKVHGNDHNMVKILADSCNLSFAGMQNVIRGRVNPRMQTLYLIAVALGTTVEALEHTTITRLNRMGTLTTRPAEEETEANDEWFYTDNEKQAIKLWNTTLKYPKESPEYHKYLMVWQRFALANIPQTVDVDNLDWEWLKNVGPYHTVTYYDGIVDIDFSCTDDDMMTVWLGV